MAFCDAHVKIINVDIDYRVYCQLMAPSDRHVRFPGRVPLRAHDPSDPAFPDPLFRFTKLDKKHFE